jgi:hypothetical protein
LALMIAPTYGASLSAETASMLDSSISKLKRKLIAEGLGSLDMSHMPSGTGHYGSRWDINTDA